MAVKDVKMNRFLPKMSETRIINRTYLLNVMNSVYPGSVKVMDEVVEAGEEEVKGPEKEELYECKRNVGLR